MNTYHLPHDDPELYARSLYNVLYNIDQEKPVCVCILHPPHTTAWHGIIDRLKKAASQIITADNLKTLDNFLQNHLLLATT